MQFNLKQALLTITDWKMSCNSTWSKLYEQLQIEKCHGHVILETITNTHTATAEYGPIEIAQNAETSAIIPRTFKIKPT